VRASIAKTARRISRFEHHAQQGRDKGDQSRSIPGPDEICASSKPCEPWTTTSCAHAISMAIGPRHPWRTHAADNRRHGDNPAGGAEQHPPTIKEYEEIRYDLRWRQGAVIAEGEAEGRSIDTPFVINPSSQVADDSSPAKTDVIAACHAQMIEKMGRRSSRATSTNEQCVRLCGSSPRTGTSRLRSSR